MANLTMNDVSDSMKRFANMSLTAFSRAKQLTEEKLNRAEKTEMDAHFENLAQRADKTKLWTERITSKTETLIQPNASGHTCEFCRRRFAYQSFFKAHLERCSVESGAKLWKCEICSKSYSSQGFLDLHVRIDCKRNCVDKPYECARVEDFMHQKLNEGKKKDRQTNYELLGQCMFDAGNDLGPGTAYGGSLVECGKSLRKIGQAERTLIEKTVSRFTSPLDSFLETDVKTIVKEKRVLLAKRLDLDACKTRVKKSEDQPPEKVQRVEADLRVAQAEFDRQYEVTKLLLDGVTTAQNSHLIALQSFIEAQAQYFDQCHKTMLDLQRHIQSGAGPPGRGVPSLSSINKPPPYNITQPSANIDIKTVLKPSITHKAKVLYDYDATEDDELSLLTDEVIVVYSVPGLDSDWMIAERGSQKGRVPNTYIEILP